MADGVKRHKNDVESHELTNVTHQLSKQFLTCMFQFQLGNKIVILWLFDRIFKTMSLAAKLCPSVPINTVYTSLGAMNSSVQE